MEKKPKLVIDEAFAADIQYEEMKAKLLEAVQDAPSAESVEPEELQRYYAKFDESFFTFCEKGKCKIIIRYFVIRIDRVRACLYV